MPLDIAVGIVGTLAMAYGFGTEASPLLLVFGVAAALLPDIDILPGLRRSVHDHRSFTHYPALYVPVTLVMYVLLGPLYAAVFALCVYAHLIHDTIGIGWGVAWLWPLSRRRFLFPEKGRRQRHGLLMSWTPEEEAALAADHHDPHWVKHFYLRPNPIAYVEYSALLVGIVALVWYLGGF